MQLIANLAVFFLVVEIALLVLRRWILAYIAEAVTLIMCSIYLLTC